MLRKRRFRELKTTNEKRKCMVGKIRSKINTICFNIFAQWQNARLTKQAANKEAGVDVQRNKIQSLDTNIVNMTAESLNFLG